MGARGFIIVVIMGTCSLFFFFGLRKNSLAPSFFPFRILLEPVLVRQFHKLAARALGSVPKAVSSYRPQPPLPFLKLPASQETVDHEVSPRRRDPPIQFVIELVVANDVVTSSNSTFNGHETHVPCLVSLMMHHDQGSNYQIPF